MLFKAKGLEKSHVYSASFSCWESNFYPKHRLKFNYFFLQSRKESKRFLNHEGNIKMLQYAKGA